MDFVGLRYDGQHYRCSSGDSLNMCVLGCFFASDVVTRTTSFRAWALSNQEETSSNITALEKRDGYVYLTDLYSNEKVPTACKMSLQKFLKLLDDWDIILASTPRPLKIRIVCKNEQFIIETVYRADSMVDRWCMKIEGYLSRRVNAIRFFVRARLLFMQRYYRRITATKRYVRLEREWKSYAHDDGSDAGMDLLGDFLERNVELSVTPYKEWLLDSSLMKTDDTVLLYKKDGCIVLKERFPAKKDVVKFAMTAEQCMQLLDDWDTKVCIPRPKIVTIWYDNDQFMIETSE